MRGGREVSDVLNDPRVDVVVVVARLGAVLGVEVRVVRAPLDAAREANALVVEDRRAPDERLLGDLGREGPRPDGSRTSKRR